MRFKVKIIKGVWAGMWYPEPLFVPAGILVTQNPKLARIFTKFPRALFDKRTDRLVHVWEERRGV